MGQSKMYCSCEAYEDFLCKLTKEICEGILLQSDRFNETYSQLPLLSLYFSLKNAP